MDYYNCKWVRPIFGHDAVTLFGNTYYSKGRSEHTIELARHESRHKRQQWDEPILFYPKYLYYNLTKGYENNPYEIDARLAE